MPAHPRTCKALRRYGKAHEREKAQACLEVCHDVLQNSIGTLMPSRSGRLCRRCPELIHPGRPPGQGRPASPAWYWSGLIQRTAAASTAFRHQRIAGGTPRPRRPSTPASCGRSDYAVQRADCHAEPSSATSNQCFGVISAHVPPIWPETANTLTGPPSPYRLSRTHQCTDAGVRQRSALSRRARRKQVSVRPS